MSDVLPYGWHHNNGCPKCGSWPDDSAIRIQDASPTPWRVRWVIATMAFPDYLEIACTVCGYVAYTETKDARG